MIAADVYSAFHEIPQGSVEHEKEIGKRFRDTFLALGGSYSCNEIFRKFRGRDPCPLALLKQLNLHEQVKLEPTMVTENPGVAKTELVD